MPRKIFGLAAAVALCAAAMTTGALSASNSWAEFAVVLARTRPAYLEHEQAKAELKRLIPDDAQQAIGHGVRAKRSKSGAISFEILGGDGAHAAVQ